MDNSIGTQQPQVVAVPQTQQYITITPHQQPGVSHPSSTRSANYTESRLKTVRGLTTFQLAIGVNIFVLHVISTAINDHFVNQIALYKKQPYYLDIYLSRYRWSFEDDSATGIWVGILISLAASLGLAGAKQQKKGLIVAHLVFNTILLFVVIPLIATVSSTIQELNRCRRWGIYVRWDGPSRYDYEYTHTTTTASPSVVFYGETIHISREYSTSRFYCHDHIFKAWLAMDSIILVSAVFVWIISLTLIIYNSTAACRSCCKGRCCGCCGSPSDTNMITYVAQPASHIAPGFSAPITVPLAPQPTFIPPQYQYQPTPLSNVSSTQAPVHVVNQSAGASVGASQPVSSTGASGAASNTQLGVGAAAGDNKWESLPPEYAEVSQNSQNDSNL